MTVSITLLSILLCVTFFIVMLGVLMLNVVMQWLESLAGDDHSSLFGTVISHKENKVL